jgi:hypothetical protein
LPQDGEPNLSALIRSILAATLLACASGCAASTESRVRTVFAIPSSSPVDTVTTRTAILRDLPIGTSKDSVLRLLAARGVGRIAHTRSDWYKPDSILVVSVDLDPSRLAIVQAEYGVGFTFDRQQRLKSVQVSMALTGP